MSRGPAWSAPEIATALAMKRAGASIAQIAAAVERPYAGVKGKMKGLTRAALLEQDRAAHLARDAAFVADGRRLLVGRVGP